MLSVTQINDILKTVICIIPEYDLDDDRPRVSKSSEFVPLPVWIAHMPVKDHNHNIKTVQIDTRCVPNYPRWGW